jgi:translin
MKTFSLPELEGIAESIRAEFIAKNSARDSAVNQSRELIRYCSLSIRACHRDDWDEAQKQLGQAQKLAAELLARVAPFPDLTHSGYTQDALKEFAEASITLAVAQNRPLPTPEQLNVEPAAYLNGLAEAAGELRRRVMDKLRSGHNTECERLLGAMDDIYDTLVIMDFPDAITGGLRRNTDMVRGVLERTRADVTMSFKEAQLQQSIALLNQKLT